MGSYDTVNLVLDRVLAPHELWDRSVCADGGVVAHDPVVLWAR